MVHIPQIIDTLSQSVHNKEFEFAPKGRDFVSVVRIREGPYYRGFFLEETYENFVGTQETVRNREVSVPRRFDCIAGTDEDEIMNYESYWNGRMEKYM